MALTSDQITAQNFKDFFDVIKSYLGYVNAGFTPVGTVISVMGNSAPQNYLECNGQTVNILDYPELAAYFTAQFGAVDNFGGDGITTFGIPDLRGEFLRGTGTNGHTNQGSGANVGEHQDATEILDVNGHATANSIIGSRSGGSGATNRDSSKTSTGNKAVSGTGTVSQGANSSYTTRPTNTSVLYCIAYKDIYVDARYDYRTTEKIVGTWIDGKPLYQKTVDCGALPNNTEKTVAHNISNLKLMVNVWGVAQDSSKVGRLLPFVGTNTAGNIGVSTSTTHIYITTGADRTSYSAYITLQYTKTTD